MSSKLLRRASRSIDDYPAALPTTVHHGGYFTNVQNGHMIVNQQPSNIREGLKLLHSKIAEGAFHDSADRGDPPRCHPRTREAILQEIMGWIENPEAREKFILWLSGPAGSGKTAILQSIAEACEREGLLGASFFFGRLANGRDTLIPVVATLAYQLSRFIPEIEDLVLTAIEKDPAIFSRSRSTQMKTLVIEPLTSNRFPAQPMVIVIDGIDECGPDEKAHKELLEVLGTAALELHGHPILFLVGSRPEYVIRTAFDTPFLSRVTESLVLDEKYSPDDDIWVYLQDEFQRIHRNSTKRSEPWPSDSEIELLVQKASGQFIFASTVVKYVDSPRKNPRERLNIVLALAPTGTETPFSALDLLYRTILSAVDDIHKVLLVLTWKILPEDELKSQYFDTEPGFLDELLGFDVRTALLDMHSLLSVSPTINTSLGIVLHHASFSDFLLDHSRSLEYYIDTVKGYEFLACRRLHVSSNNHWISRPFFVKKQLALFSENCHYVPSGQSQILSELSSFNIQELLEGMHKYGHLYEPQWRMFFATVRHQADDSLANEMQIKLDVFILDRLSQYPSVIQASVPIIFRTASISSDIEEILHITLCGVAHSKAGFGDLQQLDNGLLRLMEAGETLVYGFDNYFIELFASHDRAGKHFLDEWQDIAIAKQIVKVICPMTGEECYHELSIDRYRNRPWLINLLADAPVDAEFASFLSERTLQYKSDVKVPFLGRENGLTWKPLAKASLEYIKKCNVSYVDHSHLPQTTSRIICDPVDDSDSRVFEESSPRTSEGRLDDDESPSHPRSSNVDSELPNVGLGNTLKEDSIFSTFLPNTQSQDATTTPTTFLSKDQHDLASTDTMRTRTRSLEAAQTKQETDPLLSPDSDPKTIDSTHTIDTLVRTVEPAPLHPTSPSFTYPRWPNSHTMTTGSARQDCPSTTIIMPLSTLYPPPASQQDTVDTNFDRHHEINPPSPEDDCVSAPFSAMCRWLKECLA